MKYISALWVLILFSGCSIEMPELDNKFGKQHFVSAISMIELHKTRYGSYPETLKQLKFLGDWDAIWLSAVRYKRHDIGYDLYVERGHMGKPALQYPIEFKQGLGIINTNVEWLQN